MDKRFPSPGQTIVATPQFLASAAGLRMGEAELILLEDTIANSPYVGTSLGGGGYKMRWARPDAGKRGGYG